MRCSWVSPWPADDATPPPPSASPSAARRFRRRITRVNRGHGPSRISGQAAVRPPRRARSERQAGATVEEAVAAADEIGYPCVVKAQVQIGGRGKLGGIKLCADRDEARGQRRGDPRHGHPRPHRPRGVGRGRLADRVRVLRVGRLRPLGQGAAGDALDQGRDGHRGGRRRGSRRDRAPARRSADRLSGLPRPPARLRGRDRRRRRAPGRGDAGQALRGVRGGGGDARRGQPADHHPRARGARAGRQGHARRQRDVPPRRERRAARSQPGGSRRR